MGTSSYLCRLLAMSLTGFLCLPLCPGDTQLGAGIVATKSLQHQKSQLKCSTVFHLEVDGKTGRLWDRMGLVEPVVREAEVGEDDSVGYYLRFATGRRNGIAVPDGGKLTFEGGFTLEMLVFVEEAVVTSSRAIIAEKRGSFSLELKKGKLCSSGMTFPRNRVATTSLGQYRYYPVEREAFSGYTPVPMNRWVHLAVTYDETLKVIRTWIDGGVDRTRYLSREGAAPVLSDPTKPLELLRGIGNVRVASVELSRGARRLGPLPAMEVYVQQLPYQGKIAVDVDHIDRELPRPLEMAAIFESPRGATSLARRVVLDGFDAQQILLDAPSWHGALHTLTIKAYARGQMVYSRSVRIANPGPQEPQRIRADHSVSLPGRTFFPLTIYHVFPEDFATAAEIGFNIVVPRGPSMRFMGMGSGAAGIADIKECLDEGKRRNLLLMIEANTVFGHVGRVQLFRAHPALFGWMAFDEPWGSLEKVQESYNIVKLLDPDSPVYCVQNNTTRFAETAEGADILAADAYPIPNVSLRDVSDRTAAAVRAVGGMKPVWTILPQYGRKLPTLQEMRCMAYLAVIAGANGLGVYAWDDRPKKADGWYTKQHPSDVAVLRALIHELKSLEDILLEPNSDRPVRFFPENEALHGCIKTVGGKSYLLVASDSRRRERASMLIMGFRARVANPLRNTAPGESISLGDERARVDFEPLYAEVFELR